MSRERSAFLASHWRTSCQGVRLKEKRSWGGWFCASTIGCGEATAMMSERKKSLNRRGRGRSAYGRERARERLGLGRELRSRAGARLGSASGARARAGFCMALAFWWGRGGGGVGFGGFDEEGPAFEEAGGLAFVAD